MSTDGDGRSNPDIEWTDDGVPQSRRFDDVYFSRDNGLEESRYVFFKHNELDRRFVHLPPGELFVVAETGFGTGLNFLCTWQQWECLAPPDGQLHFISVEKYPLTSVQLRKALNLWPELTAFADRLLECYPPLSVRGIHALAVSPRVRLTLIFDDAADALTSLVPASRVDSANALSWSSLSTRNGLVDAWFLDGFAPAKNPQMWRPALFDQIAQLSRPGATFATFTAAGHVRRGMTTVGFLPSKVPGYGRKREMLRGEFSAAQPASAERAMPPTPWYLTSPVVAQFSGGQPRTVTVVGAGLAGSHTAFVLAKQGFQVTVLERATPGAGGSGNDQGVLYTRLYVDDSHLANFNLRAYLFALGFYRLHNLFPEGGQCGVLQLADSASQEATFQKIAAQINDPTLVRWLDQQSADTVAGTALTGSALHLPRSGWLSPLELCSQLLDQPGIRLISHTPVSRLDFRDGQWCLLNTAAETIHRSDAVVIACAHDVRGFQQLEHLPVKPIPGQVTQARADRYSSELRTVLCGTGYIAPASGDRHCFGATFRMDPADSALTESDHQKNLDMLATLAPALSNLKIDSGRPGRVSARCTTPDYLPVVGPVPIANEMLERFALLRHNAKARVDQPGTYWPGLFVNTGHGAKGLTSTPICAAIIGALLSGDALPVSAELYPQLHPARFLMRGLRRRKV